MACLFPEARTLAEFWENVVRKRDCIKDVPSSRWKLEDYYDPNPGAPDKTYSRRGGFIPDVAFDPVEFGLPPNVLEVTDNTQLLALLIAKEALEDAGYGPAAGKVLNRERTGVVLGVGGGLKLITPLTSRLQSPVWEEAMVSSGISPEDARAIGEKIKLAYAPWEENSFPGMLNNVVSGRVANRLDLGGMNCTVDAACASSFAALRTAVAELEGHQADVMITGGVDADNSPFMYMCFSKTPAFSKGDRVRPFDAASDGMLVGEGIGMVVLKRLADAKRDGDRVYAVIRGLGASSDGRYRSIYAPRTEGQAVALRRAYANAGFGTDTVGMIEAHGTGTVAGDLVEVSTLRSVFAENDEVGTAQVALGSVKSQIGHTKAAAGAAGLIKTALALHHKVLPPTINVEQPHPAGEFGRSALYLNTETRPWARRDADTPRRAGVSSFGFGGTNYHVVLEELEEEQSGSYRLHRAAQPVTLSAEGPAELSATARDWASRIAAEGERAWRALAKESAADVTAIRRDHARLGFAAASPTEAAELLRLAAGEIDRRAEPSWEHPKGVFYRREGLELDGAVVALFPGQGSQYPDMGRELAVSLPDVRLAFAGMDRLRRRDGAPPLSSVVYPTPAFGDDERVAQDEALRRTENAQPAIGALSAALHRLLRAAGFRPDFAAGHSFGELTALWAAGALDDDAYAELALARGRAMAPPADPTFDAGGMLAVKAGADVVRVALADLPELSIANANSPTQVVVAGPTGALVRAKEVLAARGLSATALPVSAAFHTPLVAHAHAAFAAAVERAEMSAPAFPVYSNATGEPYPNDPAEMRRRLVEHVLEPVQFQREIENVYAAGGRLFVEVGPRAVLTNLVGDILGDRPHVAIALNPSRGRDADRQYREALARLRVCGLPIDLRDFYEREPELPEPKRGPAVVTLNGANYVSDKSRLAYQDALVNGHKIAAPAPVVPTPPAQQPVAAPTDQAAEPSHQLGVLDRALSEFARLQSETLRTHQQYLADHAEQSKALLALLGQQGALPAEAAGHQTIARGLEMFAELQRETLRAHERYLQEQSEQARTYFGTLTGPGAVPPPPVAARTYVAPLEPPTPASAPIVAAPPIASYAPVSVAPPAPPTPPVVQPPPAPAPVPVVAARPPSAPPAQPSVADAPTAESVTTALLAVVSEKTGYPVETLELGMDLEADLGIDSIKRVEILGAMRERFPSAPHLKPEELAELRTLQQIVDYLRAQEPSPAASSGGLSVPVSPPPAVPAAPAAPTTPDPARVTSALLGVVSDKTGYPVETLELGMDLEADLGIDSIKRVEILGAMRERFPDAPHLKPEELAELRTLQQIVDYLGQPASTPEPAPSAPAHANGHGRVAWHPIRLKPLAPTDRLEVDLPAGSCCAVNDDGGPLGEAVVAAIRRLGWSVARVRLTDPSDAGVAAALAPLGPIAAFVHVHPSGVADGLFPVADADAARAVFFAAKQLGPTLRAAESEGTRGAFAVVTRLDGALGLGAGGDSGAIAGGLGGLVKTLALEWPGVHCRVVDLAPELAIDEAADAVVEELLDPNRLVVEVGRGVSGRLTPVPAEEALAVR